MATIRHLGAIDVLFLAVALWLIAKVIRRFTRARGTVLNGPPSESLLFGLSRRMANADDGGVLTQEWAEKYGPVFQVPTIFGARRTILCDPKAVNHFYSSERSVYVKIEFARVVIANLVCLCRKNLFFG